MAYQHLADQYYTDFPLEIEHEKTSQPSEVADWSEDNEIIAILRTVTWSEVFEFSIGFASIVLLIILAGIYY